MDPDQAAIDYQKLFLLRNCRIRMRIWFDRCNPFQVNQLSVYTSTSNSVTWGYLS
jgi:hypothetical protein